MAAGSLSCSHSRSAAQRVAFLPLENLTGDAALDWISSAGPKIARSQLLGGDVRIVPVQVGALREAYASGASQLVHGYFEKRREKLHFEFSVEDIRTHKMLRKASQDGDLLAVLNGLTHEIDSGAHAFSSTNPQAVAAWGQGDYERAVSLDPDFGAAWLDWAQQRVAGGESQQALDVVFRALRQRSLRSPVDRTQLELLSATLRQDASAQQRALEALARLMPRDAVLLRQLAAREMNIRKFSESVRLYQEALQADPEDSESWNLLGYAQAFTGDLAGAQKSFERYASDPSHTANALDSEGEAYFLHGQFAEAEKKFLEAHAKSPALLGGADLLKAAHARWLRGDLAGADQQFVQYLAFRAQQKDPLVPWRQAVWEYSTGRPDAAAARLSNVTGQAADLARTQVALWKDPSKLPTDVAALKQAYERTPPAADGITRVLLARALFQAGQRDEARKLLELWPLPGAEGDPLLQSFLFPEYLRLKRELK